jgi:hypothetical protein
MLIARLHEICLKISNKRNSQQDAPTKMISLILLCLLV